MRNHDIAKTFDDTLEITTFADGKRKRDCLQGKCILALAIAFPHPYNTGDRRRALAIEKIGDPAFLFEERRFEDGQI